MTNQTIKSVGDKSRLTSLFEYLLLIASLCIIALTATVTEAPAMPSPNQPAYFAELLYRLIITTAPVLLLVCYILLSIFARGLRYRYSGIEIPLLLFTAASAVAALASCDKRAAITYSYNLVSVIAFSILLVQLLDSQARVKLLLITIVALGIVSAYQCQEQFFFWNQQQIQFYEQNKEQILAQQNIEPGSLQQFQYEHRLYSKGSDAFFTTRNSAGCFFLLSLFASVALIGEPLKNKTIRPSIPKFVPLILAAAVLTFGLVITRSKGAIGGVVLGGVMLAVYYRFGERLKYHKKFILAFSMLIGGAAASAFIAYTITNGKIIGGNSMLVRWQYWTGSVRMFFENFFTGVGGGNFATHYLRYKDPAALEVVSDPHNFVLSILTQFGPAGLAGFLAAVFVPIFRIIFSQGNQISPPQQQKTSFTGIALFSLLLISVCLFIVRPLVLKIPDEGSAEEKRATALILYLMPVFVFALAFFILALVSFNSRNTQPVRHSLGEGGYATHNTNSTVVVLLCGLAGCLAHNLIDFAIFEPGISLTFWALMAAMLASHINQKGKPQLQMSPNSVTKAVTAGVCVFIIFATIAYCLVPPVRAAAMIHRSRQTSRPQELQKAHTLLSQASNTDLLSTDALLLNARLYLEQFNEGPETTLLLSAENCLLQAAMRNPADYKIHRHLTNVYALLAQGSTDRVRTSWLNLAYKRGLRAVELYPGSAKLRFALAQIAEQLGRADSAIEGYKEVIRIENAFRRQFRKMYPKHKIVSRLGEDRYLFATEQLKKLTQKQTP